MKKNILIVLMSIFALLTFGNFLTAEEYAKGEMIFEQPMGFLNLNGTFTLDENMNINSFNYGYGINLGEKGLILGVISRNSNSKKLNLEYVGLKNYNFYMKFLFEDWKKFYGFGSGYKISLFNSMYIELMLQSNFVDNEFKTINIGSTLKILNLELMAGQSNISLKEKTDLPFNLNKNINFGASISFEQLKVSGAARYDFGKNTFSNYMVSIEMEPFKKVRQNYYNYYDYSIKQKQLELEKEKEITKRTTIILGISALVSLVAIIMTYK